MRTDNLLTIAALGGVIWFLAKRGGDVPAAVADGADSVLRTFGVNTPNAIGERATAPDRFYVMNSLVYHVYVDVRTGASVYRAAGANGVFFNPPASWPVVPASAWAAAPVPLPGYLQLRAAGRPWYRPWDARGAGLIRADLVPR